FLKRLTGTEGPFTHAYPCGETYVGEKSRGISSVPLVAEKFYAGRSTEEAVAIPGKFDFALVPTLNVQDLSGPQIIDRIKKTQALGGWGVVMFHGVGGEFNLVTLEAHEELLAYLSKRRKELWI